jgi:4-diphosphocytidyl-2-C-methyl-D-erythritol kinase
MSVRVFAPAKINLTLKVGRPRADGLHPLQSVVVFADVGDWIETKAQWDNPLHIRGPFGPELMKADDGGNSVLSAFAAIADESGKDGAALHLTKNLPIASGIGGGSADAAATLRALNQVWSLNYDTEKLCEIARPLGADVPACVAGRSLYMTGAGETWTPITVPSFSAILVNPLKPLGTAEVYRRFDDMNLGGEFVEEAAPNWRDRETALAAIAGKGNDLEPAAISLMPEITEMKAALTAHPEVRYAALSGSGATVFALFETKEDAIAVAARLKQSHRGWWITPTTLASA